MTIFNSVYTVLQAKENSYSTGDLIKVSFGTATNPEGSGNEYWFTYYNIVPVTGHKDSYISLSANNGLGTLFNSDFILSLTTEQVTNIATNSFNFTNTNVVYDVDKKQFFTFPSGGGEPIPIGGGSGATTLEGLSDVTITGIEDKQVIQWDDTTKTWINANGGGSSTDEATTVKILTIAQAKALDFTKYSKPLYVQVISDDAIAEYTLSDKRSFIDSDTIIEFSVSDGLFLTNISNNIGLLKLPDAQALALKNTNGFLDGKVFTDTTNKILKYFLGTLIKEFGGGNLASNETELTSFTIVDYPSSASADGKELVGTHSFTVQVKNYQNITGEVTLFVAGINGLATLFNYTSPIANGEFKGDFSLTQEQVTYLIDGNSKLIRTYLSAYLNRVGTTSEININSNALLTTLTGSPTNNQIKNENNSMVIINENTSNPIINEGITNG